MSEQVYAALRSADDAGANVTDLANRYNAALNLIDRAQRLDIAGDHAGAATLAGQAEAILQPLLVDVEQLGSEALARRQTAHTIGLLEVPVAALLVALLVVALAAIRKRVEFRQTMEMRVVAK